MSIATQIERLQGVRDQIRTKMVGLGLSENTDLLQNLADDLDGVNKISPTNNGASDPGTGYTNVDTLDRSTSTRYIKVPKGYNDADRKFTVSGVANGAYSASVASHTTTNASASSSVTGSITNVASTTKPSGTDGTDYYTITPELTTGAGSSKATGKATVDTAGYLLAGNKTSSESSVDVGVTATQGSDYYLPAGSYSASVASHEVTSATAGSSVAGSITNITSTTKPSAGTDGTNYYTITPKLTTGNGSSKATGKATIGTAGYLATGDTTSAESSKTVGVTASQGSSFYLKAGSYSASVSSHTTSNATAGSSVTGSITGVATTTKPSGTDGADYYTITPKLTTGAGSSKATGKATIGTSGYLAIGNTTSEESSKTVEVTASQGSDYYLKAGSYSASVASHTASNATASSSVTGSITNIVTSTKPSTGTDGTDYYTITPKLTTAAGSSKAKGKATVDTAGYLATGNTTSSESSVDVGVTASQGDSYYLKASSVTKEDPGTSYANKATVTPSTSAQYVKVTAGYLPNSKITVEAIPNQKGKDDVTATVTAGVSDITSINASQVTDGVTVTASASGSTVVPVGYYSTQVSKAPSDSKSTTIKPKLAGTNGAIELTAGTSAFTKTSTTNYSNGFITSVKVNPTPSETKEYTPTLSGKTIEPTPGKLLSSVTVKGVPYFSVTLSSSSWKSDSNVTIGKYYYDVSNANITNSSDLYVAPGNGSVSAAQSFGVYAYSQIKTPWASTGTLQFRAIEKPTSDLTYNVFYLS